MVYLPDTGVVVMTIFSRDAHVGPVQVGRQAHAKLLLLREKHVPPFKHGFVVHTVTTNQR